MHQFCHAAFSAHCFKHIPECNTAFSSNVLLITNQILNTGQEETVLAEINQVRNNYTLTETEREAIVKSRIAHGYGNALATLGVSYVFNLVIDIVLEWNLRYPRYPERAEQGRSDQRRRKAC